MNVSTAEVLEENTRENFFVPRIVSTEPVQGKEIDLTFVQFAQRKRAATTYIENVEARRETKEIRKRNRINKAKNFVTEILCGVVMFAGFCGIVLIGTIF